MTHDEVERWKRVDALLDEALALPATQRAAFLEAQCGDDEALRQQVDELLQAHHEADEAFLEAPPVPLSAGAPAAPGAGERRIGPYRLLRELGQGGMGEVYLAERADGQFEQRVALKRIRGGFAYGAAHDRFRLERQILARLEHAHITRLIDGGVDEEGCPYLVMEYVEGTPITQYCDDQRLPVDQRLALFRTVCLAVHFAHRNLIIHRDLKPSNILVTAAGEVKLLDFGIAKLLDDAAETFPLVVTQSDQRLMTPGYAAPEQVRGEAVTTATDVYALGVILYELLTGRLPYRFPSRLLHEVERVICETAPERPSTAVVRPHLPTVSPEAVGRARGTTAERLRRRLRGDLDTIVLTALRKEPERRYASAEQFADDVDRYLAGRPVRAQRDTFSYRASKFVRRNALGVAAAAAVVLALVGGLGAAAWQAQIATREAAKARQINEFLLGMLASADPHTEGRAVTVAEVLDAAAAQLDTTLRDAPEVEADIRATLGMTYKALGLYDEAEPHLRRAIEIRRRLFGRDHLEIAYDLNRLGMFLLDQGKAAEAEKVMREALDVERRELPADHPRLGQLLNNLALVVQEQGRYEEAEALFQESLAVLRRDSTTWNEDVYTALNGYAALLHATGRMPEAETQFRELLRRTLQADTLDHYAIGILRNNLSQVLEFQGEYEEAESLLRQVVSDNTRRLGPDHPELAVYLSNLASLLQTRWKYAEAESLYHRALYLQRRAFGREHNDVAHTLNNLATLRRDQGAFEEAAALQDEAIEIYTKALGETHPVTAVMRTNMGRILYESGRTREAERYFRGALPVLQEALPGHPYLSRTLVGLGSLLADRGDAAEAEGLLREGLRIRQERLASDDWQVAQAESALGAALTRLGAYEEAQGLLLKSLATLQAKRPPQDPEVRRAEARLAALYDAWSLPAQGRR